VNDELLDHVPRQSGRRLLVSERRKALRAVGIRGLHQLSEAPTALGVVIAADQCGISNDLHAYAAPEEVQRRRHKHFVGVPTRRWLLFLLHVDQSI
jgi:hypothetical protein